jgi:hypothetical protein
VGSVLTLRRWVDGGLESIMAGTTDTNMSDPAKISQALDGSEAAAKLSGLLAVVSAVSYIWTRRALELGMTSMWVVLCVIMILVSRARRKKLKALDSD